MVEYIKEVSKYLIVATLCGWSGWISHEVIAHDVKISVLEIKTVDIDNKFVEIITVLKNKK
jgi:hypothetical protein